LTDRGTHQGCSGRPTAQESNHVEAERLNILVARLEGLTERLTDLRRYL
jgi:hypothetical protein